MNQKIGVGIGMLFVLISVKLKGNMPEIWVWYAFDMPEILTIYILDINEIWMKYGLDMH